MRRLVVGGAIWLMVMGAAALSEPIASPLEVSVRMSSGDYGTVSNFEAVATPQFLLRGTGLKDTAVVLSCSRQWSGVFLHVDNRLVALNDEANRALKAGMTATWRGADIEVVDTRRPANALIGHEDAVTRLVERANAQCNPAPAKPKAEPLTPVESASALCLMVDAIGSLAKPCEVSGLRSTVLISVDVRGRVATNLCKDYVAAAKRSGLPFGKRWKIEIRSPFSGSNAVATCSLTE